MRNQNVRRGAAWPWYVMIALLAEKVVQHLAVTAAFYFNWSDISSTVVVSPMILMVLGGAVAVLYAVAVWALLRGRAWATKLIIGLALFDIIGEMVAQGQIAIDINVSFIVAVALLILALFSRRQSLRTP